MITATESRRSDAPNSKIRQVGFLELPIGDIRPSPENNQLYRPVTKDAPELRALAKSIQRDGVQEPLVVTEDGWIISGHRRHAAAKLAGLTVVPFATFTTNC